LELTTIEGLTVLAERGRALKRPPILFVHGYFATAAIFDNYLRYFAARGHPTYAVNLRGRAGSAPTTNVGRVSMHDFLADASSIAAHLDRPIVVGHSMGGLVAQMLAATSSPRATILVSPAPPRGIPVITLELVRRQLRYLPSIFLSRPVVAGFEDFCPLVLNRVPAEAQRQEFAHFVPDSGRAGREMLLGAIRVDANDVHAPVFVVSGDDDRFIPLRVARRVAQRYGAPLHVAHGHAHLLPKEPGWERIAEVIAGWIDGLEALHPSHA